MKWAYLYMWPSLKKPAGFKGEPLSWKSTKSYDSKIRLVFFGDYMVMKTGQAPEVDSKLQEVFKRADLVLGNCEFPVFDDTKSMKTFFVFRGNRKFVKSLLESLSADPKKTVFTLANNHMGDQGPVGLEKSIETLDSLGVRSVGWYQGDRRSQNPVSTLNVGGHEIGIAAWTHWLNKDVFNDQIGVWRTEDILIPISSSTDFTIGFPHWEYEFTHYPETKTQKIAEEFLKSKFQLIVGHHSHVLQPIQKFGNKFCFYGLGNLNGPCFPVVGWPLLLGGILEMEIGFSAGAAPEVCRYQIHPFVQEKKKGGSLKLCALNEATEKKYFDRLNHVFEPKYEALIKKLDMSR